MPRKQVTIKVHSWDRNKNTGRIQHDGWHYVTVEAWRIPVPEFPKQVFYFNHALRGEGVIPGWSLTEYRTGLMVSMAPFVRELVPTFLERCRTKGKSDPAAFEQLITERLEEFGQANELPAP